MTPNPFPNLLSIHVRKLRAIPKRIAAIGPRYFSILLLRKLRAIPKRIAATAAAYFPVPSLNDAPSDPRAWVALAHKKYASLPENTRSLIKNHKLKTNSSILSLFQQNIQSGTGQKLRDLATGERTPDVIGEAIGEIVRWKTLAQCAHAHQFTGYFSYAEPAMSALWESVIWPIIKDEDFTSVLELACGHGRNTEFLRRYALSIDLVDVNFHCIEACRKRFCDAKNGCRFRYHLTNGNGFPEIADEAISFGYSWDSMVHFDKLIVQDYVKEFARVLRLGGTALLHHSNYGAVAPNSDWANNPHRRSDMTAGLMHEFAKEAGLSIKFQRVMGWGGVDDLDCLSLVSKG